MEPQEILDASAQIRKLHDFFEQNCLEQLHAQVDKGLKFLAVDFAVLSQFDPALAEVLLEQPEEILKAAEFAIKEFDFEVSRFDIRVRNLPKSQQVLVRNIRSNHINKFLALTGVVRQKSDVRPQVTSSKFECPVCGNVITILQLDKKINEPSKCGCGRKGRFRILSQELVDAQGLTLEEASEDLEGGEQPKRINVLLKNDLVSPLSEKRTNPGTKIRLTGVLKEVPVILRTGGQSTRFDLMIEANYVEAVQEEFTELTISGDELERIRELSDDPQLFQKITSSLAPSIYGHDQIKLALAIQLVGGVKKIRDDGAITRGDTHILLVGDPGSGKSMLLKRINVVAPKARFVSGKGASGSGLTAAVVRDEFLQGWALEAGALVLANKGIICIDELDKMSTEDSAAMHEALEGQSVTIAKANIQATLRAETTVLAAANPKFGRFDTAENLADQINLPSTLINRFDLIFAVKDLPDEVKDDKMASFILELHKDPHVQEPPIPTALLRKYIAYAKQNIFPVLSDEAVKEIKDYYLRVRASSSSETSGLKAVPISPRQLEGLIRLSEGIARLRLSDTVAKNDARRAVDLLDYCLKQIAFDVSTGTFDIDRIATGIPTTQRSKIVTVREIINELEAAGSGDKIISVSDIMSIARQRGLSDSEVDETIERLKRAGDIFEPRPGRVQKI